MHAQTASHQDGIVVAEMPIQHQVFHGEVRANAGQETLDHRADAGVFHIQGRIGLRLGAAPRWTPRFPLRSGQCRGRHHRRFAEYLLHLHRECLPLAATDQGEREQRDPRHGFAKDARKKAIHAESLRSCFGHHTFIPDHPHIIAGCEHLGAYEDPEDCRPGQGSMKESLDGAIAASGSRPAGETQHRHAPRHCQHRPRNPAQLPNRGHRDLVRQALEQW